MPVSQAVPIMPALARGGHFPLLALEERKPPSVRITLLNALVPQTVPACNGGHLTFNLEILIVGSWPI